MREGWVVPVGSGGAGSVQSQGRRSSSPLEPEAERTPIADCEGEAA